jgi:1,4-dihydroxy-2-naphthoate polyprenyltransferase
MIRSYLKMVRLHIVAGGLLAFTLGSLLALVNGGSFDALRFALFYMVVFFGDLSTHFSNDYFDVEYDRLNGRKTLFSGRKLLINNPNMLRPVHTISVALLSVSVLSAALAIALGIAPLELLLIAFGINFLGWFYSAPPLRLVSKGLGEVAIALAVGVGIPAIGYLAAMGHFDGWFALFVLPFLLYGFMLALSLEAPDVEADRIGDKKTLGALKGVRAVFALAFVVALVAMLVFLVVAWQVGVLALNFWVVSGFAVVPFTAGLAGLLYVNRGKKPETLCLFNVVSLFAFNVLMVVYLLMAATGVF